MKVPELNLVELEILHHYRQSNYIEQPADYAELIAIVDSLYRHANSLPEALGGSESQILQSLVQGDFITKPDSKQHAGSDYERSLQNQPIYIANSLQCRGSIYQRQLPLDQNVC